MGPEYELFLQCFHRACLAMVLLAAPGSPAAAPPPLKPAPPAQAPKASPVDEAKTLRAAGKLDAAIEVLRAANRDIKKSEGEESPGLLPVNALAGDILVDQGNLDAAEPLIERTTTLHEALIQANKVAPESLGATLLVAARIDLVSKRFLAAVDKSARATPLLEKVEGPRGDGVSRGSEILATSAESLQRLLGPADTMTSDARTKAAEVFERLGRLDQAIAQRKGILASATARADTPAIEAAAEKLGRLMAMAGRADEAIPLLKTAGSPPESRLRLLGDLQLAANRLLAADASFQLAMDSEEGKTKPSPASVAGDRLCRLLIDIRRSKIHALPEWFSTVVTPLEKNSQPEAARALIAASDVFIALGKPSDAIKPLAMAAANARKSVRATPKTRAASRPKPGTKANAQTLPGQVAKPTITPLLADIIGRLAAVHLASGNATAALEVAKPELETAAEAFGSGHGLTSLLRVMVAGGATGTGEHESATGLASQALAFGLPRPNDTWEESLVAVYDRLPSSDGKPDWRGEFIAARVRQFGEKHQHVATAWSQFGAARLAAGDWPAAAECFSKARDIQRTALGDDHPEVAGTLAMLAHAQRAGGDLAAAARTAAEAVSILERRVGLNHPATLEAAAVLATARLEAGLEEGVADLLTRLSTADAMADPVRRAFYLTRLAEVTAPKDKAKARTFVQSSMALPCWNPEEPLTTFQQRQLADTAAYSARVYRMLGDNAAADPILLRARSIALRLDTSGGLLERIERLATPER
jgi:tetratricopeptide (TPR) repeat protein